MPQFCRVLTIDIMFKLQTACDWLYKYIYISKHNLNVNLPRSKLQTACDWLAPFWQIARDPLGPTLDWATICRCLWFTGQIFSRLRVIHWVDSEQIACVSKQGVSSGLSCCPPFRSQSRSTAVVTSHAQSRKSTIALSFLRWIARWWLPRGSSQLRRYPLLTHLRGRLDRRVSNATQAIRRRFWVHSGKFLTHSLAIAAGRPQRRPLGGRGSAKTALMTCFL